ncbi:hypothetical protein PILCRDRAFT_817180, partial [Piloderma croceum F 1598]
MTSTASFSPASSSTFLVALYSLNPFLVVQVARLALLFAFSDFVLTNPVPASQLFTRTTLGLSSR